MNENERIKKKLFEFKISEFKIIRTITKSFYYRFFLNDISIQNHIEDRFFVQFKTNQGIAKFTVSANESDKFLNLIIYNSLMNPYEKIKNWDENKLSREFVKYNNWEFDEFSSEKYFEWVEKERKQIMNNLPYKINLVYTVSLQKQILITNIAEFEQYKADSNIICIENKKFKIQINLKNIFLNKNFSKILIQKMKSKNIDYKYKNLNLKENKYILIKAEAFAQFLNQYIKLFYASNIYLKNSLIKTQDLNKKIYIERFSLYTIPSKGRIFDGEGNIFSKKMIIHSGVLKNYISNSSYSNLLDIESLGNADLCNPNKIAHQRLLFFIHKKSNQRVSIRIHMFKTLSIDLNGRSFNGIALYSIGKKYFYTKFSINIDDIFKEIYSYKQKSFWNKNVYCPDIILKITN